MVDESLPPIPSAADDPAARSRAAQQHVMHGLLTALFASSPTERDARARRILDYVNRCGGDSAAEHSDGRTTESQIASLAAGVEVVTASERATSSAGMFESGSAALRVRRFGPLVRWLALPAALAAAVFLAATLFWPSTRRAMANDLIERIAREALMAMQALELFSSLSSPADSPAALQHALDEINTFRQLRDESLQVAESTTDPQERARAAHAAMEPWAQVCRRLRNIGRGDEALDEARKWIGYIEGCDTLGIQTGWYVVALDDLGSIQLARGDLAGADMAFVDSIAARRQTSQAHAAVSSLGELCRIEADAFTLPPLYWQLCRLSIAAGDLPAARRWQAAAEAALRDYYAAVCVATAAHGTTDKPPPQDSSLSPGGAEAPAPQATPPLERVKEGAPVQDAIPFQGGAGGASDSPSRSSSSLPRATTERGSAKATEPALDPGRASAPFSTLAGAFDAAPLDFQRPPERFSDEQVEAFRAAYAGLCPSPTIVTWVREYWYHEARLQMLEQRIAAAAEAIDRAGRIPLYPLCDENRLDFNLPIEAARLAIIRGDPATALEQLAEADSVSGEYRGSASDGHVILRSGATPARRAEMDLLKGLAMLLCDPMSTAAREMIRRALAVPEASTNALPALRRDWFGIQLCEWRRLIGADVANTSPSRTREKQP